MINENPVVSVIIPLYNAEKFIGECLDSLLNQTFKNFEVIVVDDCSTDSSCAVVESYVPKFGGRLKLVHMNKNSGKPSLPRNKGLAISRGEYVYFTDNDDLITPTAFEELYTLAKDFDADVVYCEKYYTCGANREDVKLMSEQKPVFVDKPVLETELLPERMKKIIEYSFIVMPWAYLSRRNLLTEHEIFFPNIIRDDSIWSWNLIFSAKKILRVPNAVYIWRNVRSSITRIEKTPQQAVTFWLNPLILGMKTLDEVLSQMDFFKNNPQHHYAMLNHFIQGSFSMLFAKSFQIEPVNFYETVHKEFSKDLGEQDVLVPALCALLNAQQKNFFVNQQKFNRFAAQAQNRIKELEAQLKITQQQPS